MQKSWQKEKRKIMENLGHQPMSMEMDVDAMKGGSAPPLAGMATSGIIYLLF